MKYILVLALCLTAVFAENLEEKPCFHCLHYNQHSQTVEEAKRQISDVVGADSQFESVGSYGVGENVAAQESVAGANSFGANSASNFGAESNYAGNSGSSFGAESGASFGAQNAASFGVESGTSFGSQSSYGLNSASNFGASSNLEANNNVEAVGSGYVIPGEVGTSSLGHVEYAQNVQEVQPVVYGGASGSESLVQHSAQHVQHTPAIIYPATGSEHYVKNEEYRVNKLAPVVTYTAPSGYERYIKYHRVVQSAPQVAQLNTVSTNSQLGSLVSGALTSGAAQNVHSGFGSSYGTNAALAANSQHRYGSNSGFNAGSSFGAQQSLGSYAHQNAALQAAQHNVFAAQQNAASQNVASFAHQSAAQLHAQQQQAAQLHAQQVAQQQALLASRQQAAFNAQQNYGFTSAFNSGFGASHNLASSSNLAATSNSAASSNLGASGSYGLHGYMSEAERLAREQALGLTSGGLRTGGTVVADNSFNSGLEAGSLGGYNAAAVNNGGYKSKSWEKASKWSTKSESDLNGNINNFKEISTGESEQYDINGKRVGYKAATSTLDDNGKVSSYSLHT